MTFHYSPTSEHYYNAKQSNKVAMLGHSVIITNWTHRCKMKYSVKLYDSCPN